MINFLTGAIFLEFGPERVNKQKVYLRNIKLKRNSCCRFLIVNYKCQIRCFFIVLHHAAESGWMQQN